MSNATTVCRKHEAPDPPPLFQNGDFRFQTHHIGFILSGTFAIISTVVSAWLIGRHLRWYTNKREQRYVVRILFMVPLYALISFASFYFWNQSTPIVLVRDSYEAIILTAFFYLLLMYLSQDPEEQKRPFLKKGLSREADLIAVQKGLPVQKWCFPLGFIKWKPSDGLYFLQLMKWAVLQYCVIRPTTTLAAVILDSVGLYCEDSWNPRWGHAYIVVIVSISVSIAMFCLVQLYLVVAVELAPYQPLLKLFSIKAVVFLTFWQATFLSVLSIVGLIKDTEYMTAEDIQIGICAVIETFEMMLFAFLHIRAFSYKPYKEIAVKAAKGRRPTPTSRLKSLAHALDFRETVREIWIGCVYMFDKMRGKEPKSDLGARRIAHYEVAFGRSRIPQGQDPNYLPPHSTKRVDKEAKLSKPVKIEVERDVSAELEGHKQFLGLSRYDRYGMHPDREKSDPLEDQINHELQKLGYPKLTIDLGLLPEAKSKRLPWWRTLYDRLSQSGQEEYVRGERESFIQRRLSQRFSRQSQSHRQWNNMDLDNTNHNINFDDDLPPINPLLPSPRASPQRRGPSNFTQGHAHGSAADNHRPTSSRDVMIDSFDPSPNFLDGVDNDIGTRTPYTERTGSDPVYHPYHHAQINRNFNLNNRQPIPLHSPSHLRPQTQPRYQQYQVQTRVQPQSRAVAPDLPPSSPTALSPIPQGALVFPPLRACLPGQDTQLELEFDPWKENTQSVVAYPYLGMDSPNYCPNPDYPPPVPPKDVPILQLHTDVSMTAQTTTIPHQRSSHRREPALPYSPSSARAPLDMISGNPIVGLPPPSGLPLASDQVTNRHSDTHEPCNDFS